MLVAIAGGHGKIAIVRPATMWPRYSMPCSRLSARHDWVPYMSAGAETIEEALASCFGDADARRSEAR
jgi:hypothetical protein